MSRPVTQRALPFGHDPPYRAIDFVAAGSNEAARRWLQRQADWPDHRLALWGEAGCGKSHLLHAWAEHGGTLLFGPALSVLTITARDAAIGRGRIAVDAADACADPAALLHLMNGCAAAAVPLLLAGRTPPSRWPTHLPDLASRLRATLAVGITAAEDTLLDELLTRMLADRQLGMAAPVQHWLRLHLPRHPAALRQAVARLDQAGLERQHALTRPVAAAVLADLLAPAADEPRIMTIG